MVDRASLFRECREALGWTQAQIAEMLRVKPRAVRYWESGDREVPGPAWVALYYILRDSDKTAQARRLAHTLKSKR